VAKQPTYLTMRDELVELCGEGVYNLLAEQLRQRGKRTHLPHPAVRR
jgi:hypothetical protein